MFTATGLLPSNTPPLNDNCHCPTKPLRLVEGTEPFAPNGLLAPHLLQASPTKALFPTDISHFPSNLENKFISNGLLVVRDKLESAECEPIQRPYLRIYRCLLAAQPENEMTLLTNGTIPESIATLVQLSSISESISINNGVYSMVHLCVPNPYNILVVCR